MWKKHLTKTKSLFTIKLNKQDIERNLLEFVERTLHGNKSRLLLLLLLFSTVLKVLASIIWQEKKKAYKFKKK